MGRKRIPRGKAREPISISLPRDLIIELDKTIPIEHSRSKLFERLVRSHLTVNTTLNDFNRHLYHCNSCHREWHMNKKVATTLMICAGETGCGSDKISYCGILEEEEE